LKLGFVQLPNVLFACGSKHRYLRVDLLIPPKKRQDYKQLFHLISNS
jgi:hypothetical protein